MPERVVIIKKKRKKRRKATSLRPAGPGYLIVALVCLGLAVTLVAAYFFLTADHDTESPALESAPVRELSLADKCMVEHDRHAYKGWDYVNCTMPCSICHVDDNSLR